MNNIGQRIKELRKKNDMTQERLADFLGVTDKAVSKWECGLTMPDLMLIVPLARVLHVSADELLSGTLDEIDSRRAEFDKHCDNWLEYDQEENYQMALEATSEYPSDYKYIVWLAHMEMDMAYHQNYKEDLSLQYSPQMMERAIEHNNIVIDECKDAGIREKAIWNAMVCCKDMGRYDDALKYAEMFPKSKNITRDSAMKMCLQGQQLAEHRRWEFYSKLRMLCVSLSEMYWFAEKNDRYAAAALDTTEAILKTVFPDGDYLDFHRDFCCVYQKRAEFEILAGDLAKAVEYLHLMMEHAKKVPHGLQRYTCGVLDGLSVDFSADNKLLYVIVGVDDVNEPIIEQLKNRVKTLKCFAPLWVREDFQSLIK